MAGGEPQKPQDRGWRQAFGEHRFGVLRALRRHAWLADLVQGLLLLLVLPPGALGVGPRAKGMEFAADLLGPDASGVREEREGLSASRAWRTCQGRWRV
jgi:hypothetical protein